MAVTRSSADAAERDLVDKIDEADAKTAGRIRLGAIQIINTTSKNDPRVKAMLKLGGDSVELTDEDKAEIARLLGISATDSGPLGLPAGGTTLGSTAPGGIIYALDESENPIPGTAFRTPELAENAGFTVIVPNPDGTIKGMKKPPLAPPTPSPAPAPADEVEVINAAGVVQRRIPRTDYEANPGNYQPKKFDATHKVVQVLELPKHWWGRRS